jgi:hypothetical protein
VRIVFNYSSGQVETHVTRLLDENRRGLIISCSWRLPPQEVFAKIRPQLTEDETREVAEALGLPEPKEGD